MRERNLIRDVAWALFAGEDATYVAGEHQPSDGELELAGKLVEAFLLRGLRLVYVETSPAASPLPSLGDETLEHLEEVIRDADAELRFALECVREARQEVETDA